MSSGCLDQDKYVRLSHASLGRFQVVLKVYRQVKLFLLNMPSRRLPDVFNTFLRRTARMIIYRRICLGLDSQQFLVRRLFGYTETFKTAQCFLKHFRKWLLLQTRILLLTLDIRSEVAVSVNLINQRIKVTLKMYFSGFSFSIYYTPKAHLKPGRTSAMEIFFAKILYGFRLLTIVFRKKNSIADFDWVENGGLASG